MAKGFLYVLSNPAFPDLVKIGFSSKVPTERAEELFTTGVPAAFVVEYYCLVEAEPDLEFRVHKALEAHRHNQGREFFRVSIQLAVSTIQAMCVAEHTWSRTPITTPRKQSEATQQVEERSFWTTGASWPKIKPEFAKCPKCDRMYNWAESCPSCNVKLIW